MNTPTEGAAVAVIKVGGRFKAIVGEVIEFGDSATCSARRAAAKHFGVTEEQIEVDPEAAVLRVRVNPALAGLAPETRQTRKSS